MPPMRLGTNRSHRNEYDLRRRNLASPLADTRGAAIRTGLANHDDPGTIEDRIRAAENAGLPLTLW